MEAEAETETDDMTMDADDDAEADDIHSWMLRRSSERVTTGTDSLILWPRIVYPLTNRNPLVCRPSVFVRIYQFHLNLIDI